MDTRILSIGKGPGNCQAALEARLGELLSSPVRHSELEIEPLADPLDQTQSGVERDMVVRRLNHDAREIQAVRVALDKVRAGVFGICDECQEPIAPARLNALPWAPLCVKCQSRSEARDREDVEFVRAA